MTISYITNRIEPKFEWFFASLRSQCVSAGVQIIDFYAEERRDQVKALANQFGVNLLHHVEPKPTVWQGKHRLTNSDYFAAANASNTAIALCRTDWIVFVDDLSVLQPGWWKCVQEAVFRNGVTCGAYRKVFDIEVDLDSGLVTKYRDNPIGNDARGQRVGFDRVTSCTGQWFFGCSFVARISDLLKCNGFDEDCDGMGYQDAITGVMMEKQGVKFWYDGRMQTWESEELHHQPGQAFIRWDPGESPNDKSHAILEMIRKGRKWAPQYFGKEGLAGLRLRILSGEQFPIVTIPQHEWFTGTPLKDLP